MADDFNPFDVGSYLVPHGTARTYESFRLQREQVHYLREIAQQRQQAPSPLAAEFAPTVGRLSEQLAEQFAGVGRGIDRVADVIGGLQVDMRNGFAGLGALFDWRMANVIVLLEQHQTSLNELLDVLKYPRRTQAKEDREDARRALQVVAASDGAAREQWLGRALGYFQSALGKNPFDYTSHLDLGTTMLGLNRTEDALVAFEEAARTAQSAADPLYESKARFFAGRAHELLGDLAQAYRESKRAHELDSDSAVLAFEHARYCALFDRGDECAAVLETCLRTANVGGSREEDKARAWRARCQNEADFQAASPRTAIKDLLQRLTDEASRGADSAIKGAERALQIRRDTVARVNELLDPLTSQTVVSPSEAPPSLGRAKSAFDGATDYVELGRVLAPAQSVMEEAWQGTKAAIERGADWCEQQIRDRQGTLSAVRTDWQKARGTIEKSRREQTPVEKAVLSIIGGGLMFGGGIGFLKGCMGPIGRGNDPDWGWFFGCIALGCAFYGGFYLLQWIREDLQLEKADSSKNSEERSLGDEIQALQEACKEIRGLSLRDL